MGTPTRIRGATPEQREAARQARRRQRRAETYTDLMREAPNAKEQLRRACEYMRAVANDMDPADVNGVVQTLTRIADDWNRR